MKKRVENMVKNENVAYWGMFAGRTVFYLAILLVLVYLYHFSHIDGANFIYNEF